MYIGQKGDHLAEIPKAHPSIDEVYLIQAGKFRRYHGEGLKQLLDLKTGYKNVRDVGKVTIGAAQAYSLLGKIRPDVVFTPGGFVGVPVGLAASRRKIPFVTHDLDALPGLANRINARWASIHAVGMPPELYPYPAHKTRFVGVPTSREFQPVTQKLQQSYREKIGLGTYEKMLFVVGGGLGAQRINTAVLAIAHRLLAAEPGVCVVHGAGKANQADVQAAYERVLDSDMLKRVQVMGYIDSLYRYSGAADVIITRAGATNMAEFTIQKKACIVIPSPFLAGGHQLKNVEPFVKADAIVVVDEAKLPAQPEILLAAVQDLLDNANLRQELGERLGLFAAPDAAGSLAKLVVELAESGHATS